jgi:hypothetical protein
MDALDAFGFIFYSFLVIHTARYKMIVSARRRCRQQ